MLTGRVHEAQVFAREVAGSLDWLRQMITVPKNLGRADESIIQAEFVAALKTQAAH